MSANIVGVDLGTSACKTVVFSLDGEKVAEAKKEYPIYHPKPRFAEQNPLEWWDATSKTIRKCVEKGYLNPGNTVALSVSSQREAVVPIGHDGKELYNSIIWLDTRTNEQAEKIKSIIEQEKVLSITGLKIDPIFSASKILWLRDKVPNVFQKTKVFLCAKDYIVYKLTGELATDYSMASRTMMFDIKKKIWSNEICSNLGISIDKLPLAKESSEVVGEVTPEASKKTLLPIHLPVVNGGGDRPCECLGAGVTKSGAANIGTGTGSMVEVPINRPNIDPEGRVNCCCHVIPNRWEYETIVAVTGGVMKWFKDNFGNSYETFDLLIKEASKVEPGSEGLFFYPHLSGSFFPVLNSNAKGVYYGINLSHRKEHFIRSLLEGVAFQYKEAITYLDKIGVKIEEANMVGGETRSSLWNQIKADVLGINLHIPEIEDASSLGAAILAGIGTKQYTSIDKAVQEVIRIKNVFKPKKETLIEYKRLHKKYMKAYSFIEKAYSTS